MIHLETGGSPMGAGDVARVQIYGVAHLRSEPSG